MSLVIRGISLGVVFGGAAFVAAEYLPGLVSDYLSQEMCKEDAPLEARDAGIKLPADFDVTYDHKTQTCQVKTLDGKHILEWDIQ